MANSSDNISKFFHNKTSGWLRLDTVARIYAAIMGSRSPTAFRICAVTKNTIDPETLQTALDDVLKRFPYFRMKLKFGLFWNFLQNTGKRPLIEEETHIPCREFTPEEPLFRVIYRGNRISLEFSHVLTDGIGGLTFTRSLIAHYFRLKGCDFEYSDDLYDLEKTPLQEETEDAFERYFPGNIPSPEKLDTAFHIKGKLLPRGDLNVITGTCNSGILLDVCRKFCVTVNDFLAAHYLWALYRLRGKCNRDIRLLVPVNLRSKYPSKTIRNF
ncbi:MAG: hypothetical protein GX640_07880, partial [Fibrobacter sp.]|nr:hypothetical protein [Fibrobacter sp.]